MAAPISILMYGRDARLLETRLWVLEAAGFSVLAVTELSEIDCFSPAEHFDLLILCHSLLLEDYGRASAIARFRWPAIKSLVLAIGRSGCPTAIPGEVLDTMRGPKSLITEVARLVDHIGINASQVL